MQVDGPLPQLGKLAETAGDGEVRDRVAPHIFEHTADKIAHVDERDVGHLVVRAAPGFRGCARRGYDMGEIAGTRDVHAAMYRGDPGGTGERAHHPGGAQDGDPALYAKARIPSLGCDGLTVAHKDLDLDVLRPTVRRGKLGHGLFHHTPRHRVDGWLANRDRQAGLCDQANPLASRETDTLPLLRLAHDNADDGAMRDIGVVAGVLDHSRAEPLAAIVLASRGFGYGEFRLFLGRGGDDDIFGELAGGHGGVGGMDAGGRAGARGPAKSEFGGERLVARGGAVHCPFHPSGRCPCMCGWCAAAHSTVHDMVALLVRGLLTNAGRGRHTGGAWAGEINDVQHAESRMAERHPVHTVAPMPSRPRHCDYHRGPGARTIKFVL